MLSSEQYEELNKITDDEEFMKRKQEMLQENAEPQVDEAKEEPKTTEANEDTQSEDDHDDDKPDESNDQSDGDMVKNDDVHMDQGVTDQYKKLYDEITAPVKARGKFYTYTDPKDIRSLVQKGIDYAQNQARLKEHSSVIALLDQAGLIKDKEALRVLIDLHKGDKDAISHLLKSKGINLEDLVETVEKVSDTGYSPKTADVSQDQALLNEAISMVEEDTQFGNLVISFVKGLPKTDIAKLEANPGLLTTLLEHARAGILQQVTHEMSRLNHVGRLDLSRDVLKSYNAVFEQFANQREPEEPVPTYTAPPKKMYSSEPQRKAVTSPRQAPVKISRTQKPVKDRAWAMKAESDKEFLERMKQVKAQEKLQYKG